MAIILSLYIDNEVKVACLKAISSYCRYRGESVFALEEGIDSEALTRQQFILFKQSIKSFQSISHERKQDIENLIDIIDQEDTTVGTLYADLLTYLNTIKTGWWIFQTGNSELKNRFIAVMHAYSAKEWDRKMLEDLARQANEQQQAEYDKGNSEQEKQGSDHARSLAQTIRYTQENLGRYEAELGRTTSPPLQSRASLASTHHELETLLQTPPERFSLFPVPRRDSSENQYTAASMSVGSVNQDASELRRG